MKRIFALLLFVLAANAAPAQDAAVRVNALALATGTLNAGVDVTVSRKWSITASGYWNPIATDNLRMQVLAGTVGVRRWRCEPHAGLFWGLHGGGHGLGLGGAGPPGPFCSYVLSHVHII